MFLREEDKVANFEGRFESSFICSASLTVLSISNVVLGYLVDSAKVTEVKIIKDSERDVKKRSWMSSGVKYKRSVASSRVDCVIDAMFNNVKLVRPIILVVVAEVSECLNNPVVLLFSLAISLRMVTC